MNSFTFVDFKKILDSCVGVDDAAVLDESRIDMRFNALGFDSLAVYEIVTRLQDDLKISVSDEEIDALTSARTVIEFVNSRLALSVN